MTKILGSFSPISRAVFLRGAAALAATPLLPALPHAAGAAATLAEVAPGVFVHQGRHALFGPDNRGDVSNCGFVVGGEAVAVIDTGGSARFGEDLRASVRAATDRPIRYVVNTHMHPDHVFGNAAFEADKPAFIGHHKLGRALAARADRYLALNRELMGEEAFAGTRIVLPTMNVNVRTELDLGGRTLVLEAHPTAHTDNDLTVHDTATSTLFLGDLLFVDHVPTLDGSIRGWLALIPELRRHPAARAVPGHGPAAVAWPAAIDPLERYLGRVATDVRALIKAGKTLAEAARSAGLAERDAWQLFDEYHARNVSAAFAELEWE